MKKAQMKGNKLRSESLRAVVLADDMTIRWSEQEIPDDHGCVRTTQPISRDCTHFVFETEIVSGEDVILGIAVFESDGKRNYEMGYNFFGKNGQVKVAPTTTQKYAPFKAGDVVACGVSFLGNGAEPFVFFALNGEMFDPLLPWKGSRWVEHYAFVSSPSPGNIVKVSLDESIQLKWEPTLRRLETQREKKRLTNINADFDPLCEKIVRDFLLHQGYVETLRAMNDELVVAKGIGNQSDEEEMEVEANVENNGNAEHEQRGSISRSTSRKRSASFDRDLEFAKERRKVRGLVLEGHPVEAIKVVNEKWPEVLATPIGLELRIQCLVELISSGNYFQAVQLARTELWPYISSEKDKATAATVKKALGLLALPDLKTDAAIAKLSALDRKRAVADALNRALLFHPKPPMSPALERILMKLAEAANAARDKSGGYGTAYQFPKLATEPM